MAKRSKPTRLCWSDLIRQDVEQKPGGGCQIKEGTEKDRLISVHDPEMRHGRKSASKTFNGTRPAVAVDMESQLICGVEVFGGQRGRSGEALGLGAPGRTGDGSTSGRDRGRLCLWGRPDAESLCREQRLLTAKVPTSHNGDCFPKSAFAIDFGSDGSPLPAGTNDDGI